MTRDIILKQAQSKALEELPVLISLHDRQGNIVWANSAYLEATGLSQQGIQDENCYSLWGLDQPCHDCPVKRAIQTGKPAGAELTPQKQILGPDSKCSLLAKATPLKDEDGNIIGAIEISFDIGERLLAERRQAEKAIQSSQKLQSAILNNIPDIAWLKDSESRYVSVNEAFARSAGYASDDLVGKTDLDVWPRELAEKYRKDDIHVMRSRRQKRVEERVVDSLGNKNWVETIKNPIFDEAGAIIGTIGIARDITERKRAEEAIRQANLVVENSPVMLFRWRAAEGWPVEMVSHNVSQLGYAPEELLSGAISFASVIHPDDLDRITREVQEYSAAGIHRFQQEYRVITKDGHVRWVDDRTLVERNSSGQITHYQGIVIDITERKRTEEALRHEKYFTDTVIDSMPGIFYVFDEQGRLTRWNRRLEHISGYNAEAISQMTAIDFFLPEDQSRAEEAIKAVFIEGESHLEARFLTTDGATIPFYLTGVRIVSGQNTYLLGVGLDIRERVRAEAESARLQALLQSVILQSPVPMVLALPDGTVELFNESCRVILGVGEEVQLQPDLNLFTLEKTWTDYNAEGGPVPIEELPLALALRGKITRSREMRITRQNGTERWILVDAVPVLDDYGAVMAGFLMFIDITDRKRAEDALQTSKTNLQLAFEAARLGVWSWDILTGKIDWSSQCKALYGIPADTEMSYELFMDRVHPEDRQRVDAALKRALETKGDYDVEKRVIWPDGSLRWNATLGRVFCNTDGYPVRMAGVTLDITDRKRAEENLAESMRRLQTVVTGAPIVLYSFDRHGVFTLSEGKGLVGLGIKPGEIVGRTIYEVYGDQPQAIAALRRAMAGESFTLELSFPAGGTFEVSHTAMLDEAGNYNGTIGVLVDITERKRAEIALRESEERLRLALLAADQGLYDLNVQTREIVVSPAYARMLGYEPDSFRETLAEWYDRLHPDDHEQIKQVYQEYLKGQRNEYRIEYRQRTRSGDWKWILSLGKIVETDKEGKPLRMLGTHTDVTERKRAEADRLEAERNLLHAQKLESLGVLAGGIAHDFNNLLVAILGHADLALLKISPLSPVRQNIQEIINASHRAADLCRQMLAYSGKGKFVIEHLQLGELIYEMTHILKTCIPKKVLLNFNLANDLPSIEGDPAQIRQVLMNLVMNASEAIGDKSGIVTISTGAKHCDAEYLRETFTDDSLPEGLYVSLEVSDTGCGMDREVQARIFEPFFSTKFTGRGLGMSAVLGIVRGHKGTLKVYSEPGKGTTFRLLFPASVQKREEFIVGKADSGVQFHGTGTVLLVDDEETVLGVGRLMLETLGYSVITAEDGKQAVEIYSSRKHEIAVVLLDLTMPRMNGEEAFRELRRINPGVRVILASGYSEHEITARFAGKGLAGFIQKPFAIKELAKIVHESLEDNRG